MFCCIDLPVSTSCRTKIILATIFVLGVLVSLMGHALHRRSTYTLEYCQFKSCDAMGVANVARYSCALFTRYVSIRTSKPCDAFSAKLHVTRYSNIIETVDFKNAGYLQFFICFGLACVVSYVFLIFCVSDSGARTRRQEEDWENGNSSSASMDTMSDTETSESPSSSIASSDSTSTSDEEDEVVISLSESQSVAAIAKQV